MSQRNEAAVVCLTLSMPSFEDILLYVSMATLDGVTEASLTYILEPVSSVSIGCEVDDRCRDFFS